MLLFAYKIAIYTSDSYVKWLNECRAIEAHPLHITEAELALGEMLETDNHLHKLTIRNRSNKILTINTITASCECAEVKPNRNVEVAAGQSVSVAMNLRAGITGKQPKTGKGEQLVVALRAQYATHQDDTEKVCEWLLTATILPVITVQKRVVDVGSHSLLGKIPEQRIEVDAEPFIHELLCSHSPSWVTQVTKQPQSGTKPKFSVTITSASPLSPRTITDTLKLVPITQDGKQLPGKEIHLRGEILPDIILTPGAIQVGRRTVGTTVAEWVRVRSLTNRPVSIDRVEVSEGLSAAVDAANSWQYRLEVRVDHAGENKATASFHVRDEAGGKHTITVVVRYEGQAR